MKKKEDIIQQYVEYFDDCRPLTYHGIEIKPFLAKDIRKCNYCCYCLSIDPLEYDDISLMPLRRLGLVLTIFERIVNNKLPENEEIRDKYLLTIQSFKHLLQALFPNYLCDFTDPENPNRKRILRLADKNTGEYQIINEKEFEDLSDLILYYNGIDTSYKQIPPAMRKEADRVRELLNRKNKSKAPSIEKMIDSAFLILKDYDKVLNLPVRKFYNLIINIQKREEYSILMSGMYVVKGVEHWMGGDYTKNVYDGVFSTESETKKQLNDYKL